MAKTRRTHSRSRPIEQSHTPAPLIKLRLSQRDLQTLADLADYYQRSMGPMRHVVRLSAPAMRRRFSFVAEESRVLRAFAQASLESARESGVEVSTVSFTPRSLVAFWGRALSSLRSPRSRRRLSDEEATHREGLATRLREEVQAFGRLRPDIVLTEIESRRLTEKEWMRELLADTR